MPAWILLPLALLALWAAVRWFEQLNLYFPSRGLFATPRILNLPFEDVRLDSGGATVHGWYVPGRPGAPVLLYCHGNGGNISSRLDKLAIMSRLGVGVLLFDYRGYGESTGRPSEAGLYADGKAFWDWLTGVKGVPPGKVVLYGESLGGAVCADLATKVKPGGLVLESTFTNTEAMGRLVFPILPVSLMVSQRFDTLGKVSALTMPTLVLHSPEDDIIPFAMGEALYAALPGPKEFSKLSGDHNEGFLTSGDAYPAALAAFLKKYFENAKK